MRFNGETKMPSNKELQKALSGGNGRGVSVAIPALGGPDDPDKKLMTVKEAAAVLRIRTDTLYM